MLYKQKKKAKEFDIILTRRSQTILFSDRSDNVSVCEKINTLLKKKKKKKDCVSLLSPSFNYKNKKKTEGE